MAQPMRPAKCRVSVITGAPRATAEATLEVVAQTVEEQAVVEPGQRNDS